MHALAYALPCHILLRSTVKITSALQSCMIFSELHFFFFLITVVPDPQPPCRPLPPTPRDEPGQSHKVSTPPSNHQLPSSGGSNIISSGQVVSQRNSHVFKPTVNIFFYDT